MGVNRGVFTACSKDTAIWCAELSTEAQTVAASIAADTRGNLAITGYTTGNLVGTSNRASRDVFVAKYTTSGVFSWVRQFGTEKTESGRSIAIDANGEIVVTGADEGVRGVGIGIFGGFVSKLSSDGELVWTQQSTSRGESIALDASGNIVIAGDTESGGILNKYSPSGGAALWSKHLESDGGGSVAIDAEGNILHVGSIAGIGLVEKLSASGDVLWSNRFGSGHSSAVGVTIDPSGNALVVGRDNHLVLQRYSGTGDLLGSTALDDNLYTADGIAFGGSDHVFIVGMANHFGGVGFDAFVAQYSVNGTLLSGESLGLAGSFEGFSLATAGDGEVFVAGPLLTGAFVAHVFL